jgi:hypothetical protein
MAKRFLRIAIKVVGYAAGLVFFFDISFTDWGIGLVIASVAIILICVFLWTHFDLGDTYDEDEPAPNEPLK